ncbi:uncharacterized protein Fot_04205 [Forsythia ovata]|uniref:Uncharacterized protein n=1 Tax=Forsythia ovata TaxID=205694 RepID=A0ABD1XBW5_9LAMI
MASKSNHNLSSQNGNVNLKINWGVLQEISFMLKSVVNSKDFVPKKKAEVVENMRFLVAEIIHFSEKKSPADEYESMLGEATNTIGELEQLSSLLEKSDLEGKDSLKIGDLLKSLESRRPKLDFFFSRFVAQNDADESNKSSVSCDMEFSNSNGTNDDKKDLPVAVASGTQSMPNQASECS